MTNKILVLGSSNVDFILKIPRFHNPGETIKGESLVTAFGGKGANQVIAVGALTTTKLGAQPPLPSQPDLERFLRKQGKKG
jgi:sugar/nucleoside kinase (ribokinase family)